MRERSLGKEGLSLSVDSQRQSITQSGRASCGAESVSSSENSSNDRRMNMPTSISE
jgi:hypothetical protein